MVDMAGTDLRPWRVHAVNLPEHAGNPIHTDGGAQAAGYPSALVAGVTTYAYLTHPAAAAWGAEWVQAGGSEVRFLGPVLAGDVVDCVPVIEDGLPFVEARVGADVRARCRLWPPGSVVAEPAPGEGRGQLEPAVALLDGARADYGRRVGDDLALYDELGVVHPAVWPVLANDLVHDQLVDGSWIHTRSRIRHLGLAPVGATVVVDGTVVDRFETRSGERAVVDVTILLDDEVVARIEHEALVRLQPPRAPTSDTGDRAGGPG